MLVSTEPLARRHQRRSAAHRTMAIVFASLLVVANVLLFGATHSENLFGEVVDVSITNTRTWVTRNKNSSTTHYAVLGNHRLANGDIVALEGEVGRSVYADARAKDLTSIPFRVVLGWPTFYTVGTGATIGPWRIIVPVLTLGGLVFLYMACVKGAREWYELAKITETNSGRLPR